LFCKEINKNHSHPFLLRCAGKLGRYAGKMMEDVTGLSFIPPTEGLNFNAKLLQRSPGLFDLNLGTAVSQAEGDVATEDYLHHEFLNRESRR